MRARRVAAGAVVLVLVLVAVRYFRGAEPPAVTGSAERSRALAAVPADAKTDQPEPARSASTEDVSGPSAENRRPLVVGPRGRVLEAGTDRPIDQLVVRMTSGTKTLAEAITGPDGSFSLPAPDRSRRTVQVVSDAWRTTPRTYRLDEDQSSGVAELLFRAERIVAAPLRGLLVDRSTGEPVPDFLVQARGPRGEVRESQAEVDADGEQPATTFRFLAPPRRVENIVTGADGRFASEGGFEAGLLDLVLVDHARLLERAASFSGDERAVEHRHTFDAANPAADAEIEVAIGPTYRLDVALPSDLGVDEFHATFLRPSAGLRELHRAVAGDPNSPVALFFRSALKPDALGAAAPLRNGEPLWVRFRDPVLVLPGASGAHELHLRSRDGHWSGSAPVDSVEGVHPAVVRISLEARGSLEGIVRDRERAPVPSAWIRLIATAAATSPLCEVGAEPDGRFAFKWLAEGEYAVIVETDLYPESRSPVSITKGITERLDITLSSGVALGTVAGALRSRTGRHRSKGGTLVLERVDEPGFFRLATVTYRERNGESTAEFEFVDVPVGDYELRLRPLDNMLWNTRVMKVTAPAAGLEFICEDDTPTFDLGFRAFDAASGSPIDETWTIVWQGDPLDDLRLDDDWETGLYEDVPEGVPHRWMLRAEGYRLATGDDTDIRAESDRRVVEARLERGWGQLFKVTTRDQEPIERVEVFADGETIGTTDAQGMVSMNLDAKPRSLEFRYGDWIVIWGRVDPNEEGFGSGAETPVYLGPP